MAKSLVTFDASYTLSRVVLGRATSMLIWRTSSAKDAATSDMVGSWDWVAAKARVAAGSSRAVVTKYFVKSTVIELSPEDVAEDTILSGTHTEREIGVRC